MRIRVTLEHDKGALVPINYHYFVSSWIYKALHTEDEAFATQLHNEGFRLGHKQFKLFTFSDLKPSFYRIQKSNRGPAFTQLKLEGPTTIDLSFFVPAAAQHFIYGTFKDKDFFLHKTAFKCTGLEVLPAPAFSETMQYRSICPIFMSKKDIDTNNVAHLNPLDADFSRLIMSNLVRKKNAYQGIQDIQGNIPPYRFTLLSAPEPKLRRKEHLCFKGSQFSFELNAPIELHEIGYSAGFGGKNSGLGMGMVEVL